MQLFKIKVHGLLAHKAHSGMPDWPTQRPIKRYMASQNE